MMPWLTAALLACCIASTLGCGKYGPPVRQPQYRDLPPAYEVEADAAARERELRKKR